MNISETLLKSLNKVDKLAINHLDKSQGEKEGTLFSIKPSYKFKMMTKETQGANGKWTYESAEPKPFDMDNILLINRYKSKSTGDWIEDEIPAFVINLKSTEKSDDNKTRYFSMIFRGTSLERLISEIVNAHETGEELDRAKAFYSIIDSNELTPKTFFEHLQDGASIEFAQYKRGYNMNFVDTKYYREKYGSQIEDDL